MRPKFTPPQLPYEGGCHRGGFGHPVPPQCQPAGHRPLWLMVVHFAITIAGVQGWASWALPSPCAPGVLQARSGFPFPSHFRPIFPFFGPYMHTRISISLAHANQSVFSVLTACRCDAPCPTLDLIDCFEQRIFLSWRAPPLPGGWGPASYLFFLSGLSQPTWSEGPEFLEGKGSKMVGN